MSDKMKFWLQTIVAVVGAASATMSQIFVGGEIPEVVRIIMLIGGGIAAAAGAILAKQTFSAIRAFDIDGDGKPEIVIELKDEEKNDPPASTPPVAMLFLVGLLVLSVCGCGVFEMHAYDPMTIAQIQNTITYENADFQMADRALESLQAPDLVRDGLKARHDSEIARLEAWLMAEEAKKVEEGK